MYLPRNGKEMMEQIGLLNRRYFSKLYLKLLLEEDCLRMTIPDKTQRKKQEYEKIDMEGKAVYKMIQN